MGFSNVCTRTLSSRRATACRIVGPHTDRYCCGQARSLGTTRRRSFGRASPDTLGARRARRA
eukprot:6712983-Prymnesium_polylepis.1